jgi:hypothetical protein
MAPSFYDQITREHPAYRAGFARGRDVGLVIALNAIVAEQTRQGDSHPHEYAAGRLGAVARIVGAAFRSAAR